MVQILLMVAIARKCQESFLKTDHEVMLTASKLQLLEMFMHSYVMKMLTSFQNAHTVKKCSKLLKILMALENTLPGYRWVCQNVIKKTLLFYDLSSSLHHLSVNFFSNGQCYLSVGSIASENTVIRC